MISSCFKEQQKLAFFQGAKVWVDRRNGKKNETIKRVRKEDHNKYPVLRLF